jgi:hypothetical protein
MIVVQQLNMIAIENYYSSKTARKNNINNIPDATIKSHLQELNNNLVSPAQDSWKSYASSHGIASSGFIITSGYRSSNVNSAVGGSPASAHTIGYAADVQPIGGNKDAFFQWAIDWAKTCSCAFDQIILEGTGTHRWVHFGYKNSNGQQRKQILSSPDTKSYTSIGSGTGNGYDGQQPSIDYEFGDTLQEFNDSTSTDDSTDWDADTLYDESWKNVETIIVSEEKRDDEDIDDSSTVYSLSNPSFIRTFGAFYEPVSTPDTDYDKMYMDVEKRILYAISFLRNDLKLTINQACALVGLFLLNTNGYLIPNFKNSVFYGIYQWKKDEYESITKQYGFNCLKTQLSHFISNYFKDYSKIRNYKELSQLCNYVYTVYTETDFTNVFVDKSMNQQRTLLRKYANKASILYNYSTEDYTEIFESIGNNRNYRFDSYITLEDDPQKVTDIIYVEHTEDNDPLFYEIINNYSVDDSEKTPDNIIENLSNTMRLMAMRFNRVYTASSNKKTIMQQFYSHYVSMGINKKTAAIMTCQNALESGAFTSKLYTQYHNAGGIKGNGTPPLKNSGGDVNSYSTYASYPNDRAFRIAKVNLLRKKWPGALTAQTPSEYVYAIQHGAGGQAYFQKGHESSYIKNLTDDFNTYFGANLGKMTYDPNCYLSGGNYSNDEQQPSIDVDYGDTLELVEDEKERARLDSLDFDDDETYNVGDDMDNGLYDVDNNLWATEPEDNATNLKDGKSKTKSEENKPNTKETGNTTRVSKSSAALVKDKDITSTIKADEVSDNTLEPDKTKQMDPIKSTVWGAGSTPEGSNTLGV